MPRKPPGFILLFFLLPGLASSQSLVLNGGFEDINICTEYRVECAPEAWISSANGFANYFKDRNRAHTSLNCMAIEAGNFAYQYRRSLIRTPLVCGMRKGAQYRIGFYVKSAHDIFDSLGILFTDTDPLYSKEPIHKRTATLYLIQFADPARFSDSNWYNVELIYTATGDERFFALGYFARNDYVGERSHPLENRYFVFFDDIYISPVDPAEGPCRDYAERKEIIYDENERHGLLEKKISYYKKNPPPPPPVLRNVYVKVDTITLPDILFASGKARLEQQSFPVLDSLLIQLKKDNVDSLVVEGHTDNVGTIEFNEKLSLERAIAVREYLSARSGFDPIVVRGWGFRKPITGNETPAGRQRNRRVEVILYIRE